MAFDTTVPRFNYIGTGSVASYGFPNLKIAAGTDLRVTKRDTAGVETTLVFGVDFTIPASSLNNVNGGTLTLTAGNLTLNHVLTIRWDKTPQQGTDFRNQGGYFGEVHEDKYDEIVRYVQALRDVLARSLHLPETEVGSDVLTKTPSVQQRASRFAFWDSVGALTAAAGLTPPNVTVSAFMETLLDDATAATGRATLGVPSTTEAILNTFIAAKGDLIVGTANDTPGLLTVGVDGSVPVAEASVTHGMAWMQLYPKSLAPNPFFEVDQLALSAMAVADDQPGHDHWYPLTQTATVQLSTQTGQENGQSTNARLTQNQAAAQRMGYACIVEASEVTKWRGLPLLLRPRIRISTSQPVRVAVLEWIGTADAVTSDVVNDWTNGTYTLGQFFVSANFFVSNVGVKTPSAATWTDMDALNFTPGGTANNVVLFIWTEDVAAQNLTLDIGKVRLVSGLYKGEIERPTFQDTLRYAQRFFQKSFRYGTAPAQNVGVNTGEHRFQSPVGASGSLLNLVRLVTPMRIATSTPILYNPSAANAELRNITDAADCSGSTASNLNETSFYVGSTGNAGCTAGDVIGFHWTMAARL